MVYFIIFVRIKKPHQTKKIETDEKYNLRSIRDVNFRFL